MNTDHSLIDRTLALSGVIQSSLLVDTLVTTGEHSSIYSKGLLQSVFQTDPETALDVYGDYHAIRLGLTELSKGILKIGNSNILNYFMNLLVLQKKLQQRNDLMQRLDAGIANTKARLLHFPVDHENILSSLADVYSQTISKLSPRIMIRGNPEFLAKEQIVNQARAYLLTGVRSAVLWSQCGGTRLNFLWTQKKITATADMLVHQYLDN